MCGIVGYLGVATRYREQKPLARMTALLAHRGPDAAGHWHDEKEAVWLGHRRLAIVDLSAAGEQPMTSPSGRFVLVFNGEIYNHLVLRQTLTASNLVSGWRGHSDTETLLAGFDAWGIESTIKHSVGMFACAIWDRAASTLTLVRDRLGEKPLYYGWQGQGADSVFLFASELKALRAHPAFEHRINRDALCAQLRHNYIPAPYSIYEGIAKLRPGNLLTVSLRKREPCLSIYWDAEAVAAKAVEAGMAQSPEQAIAELETILCKSVARQMVADVPLGAFLSGGIDSSTIVALMQAQSKRPVKTFTIGFREEGYNEADHARAVAQHLGTDHTELYVTGAQAQAVIPALPSLFDEPFSDPSQIPTYLVSRLARKQVIVSLSGDGGDELFCGYQRYQKTEALWARLSTVPAPLQRLAGRALRSVSNGFWDYLESAGRRMSLAGDGSTGLYHKVGKMASALDAHSLYGLYRELLTHWPDPASVVIDGKEPDTLFSAGRQGGALDPVQQLMLCDLQTYLPDDVLVKVDRAAMGVSLETRAPFLDHELVEFAWRLPQSMKLAQGVNKWALRQVLYRHVPQSLVDRPKMGFGVPVGDWLRGPLRDWADALLDPSRLKREGFLRSQPIARKWEEHLSGKRDWQYQLWDVLMFQSWLENQKSTRAALPEGSVDLYRSVA
jgi:asparagine synthase (glutamine-hydrolysing)